MSTVGARLRIATALTGAGAMDYGCVRRATSRSRRDRVGRAPGARQLCVEKARVQWRAFAFAFAFASSRTSSSSRLTV